MINSIPKIEQKDSFKFGQVTSQKLPSDFWLPIQDSVEISKPKEEEIKQPQQEVTQPIENTEEEQKITITTPDKARKTKNLRTIGLSIAGATVLTAAGIFLVLKGGTKGLTKNFEKLRDYLERQLLKSKLENEGEMTFVNKVYVYMIKSLDTLVRKTEAINNFTNLKDLTFKKMMGPKGFLKKAHDSITRLFEKIGRKSVKNAYNSTSGRMKETALLRNVLERTILAGDSYDIVNINGVRKTKAQWLAQVDQLAKEMEALYQGTFSERKLGSRYLTFKRAAMNLQESFSSLDVFWTKDFFTKFMAESQIVKEKELVQKAVHKTRRQLSYSMADMVQDSNNLIMRMTGSITFKDANRIRQLRVIKTDIRNFATSGNNDPVLKARILDNISSFTKDLKAAIQNKTIDEKVGAELLENITDLNDVVANYRPGKVEEILNIYKAILPKDEYAKIEKSYKSGVKSLDKSIRIETEEFVSKLRDLTLGSAPTDILTMLGAVGLLGYQIGKSDTNDERLSITLKYGIPALLGQVGVTLYCNAKLFAGTKSLMMGTLSGLLLNRVGEFADNQFKKYKQKKLQQAGATVVATQIKPNEDVKNPTKTV